MGKPVNDWPKWYSAQNFGVSTTYGYHEGIDLNRVEGGDSDLDEPLLAVSKGRLVYYHLGSHPTTGFGRHLVYYVDTWFGERWVHYAHCADRDFTGRQCDLAEGVIVGRVGKSGTPVAHLHMAVFKKDPATHPRGIDAIAHTTAELNEWWQDPIDFLAKLENKPVEETMPDEIKYVEGLGEVTFDKLVAEYGLERHRRITKEAEFEGLESANIALADRVKALDACLANAQTDCQTKIVALETQIKSMVAGQTETYDVGQALQVLVGAIKRAWNKEA